MLKQLPERANLEHLKTQAKSLLSSLPEGSRLADAQRELARDYGFASWTRLKRFVESREDRQAAFFRAIRGGDRAEVNRLLDEDAALITSHDPNNFEAVPLTLAADRDDHPMIDLLIERGADPNARSTWWAGGFSALDLCSEPTAHYLLTKGAKLTAHVAARLGMAKDLQEILVRNLEAVHERGGDGQYPLHFAKTPEIVDILVDAGADLKARDLDHEGTAAQWRIQDADVLRRLLERGAEPDIYMAVMLEDIPLIKRLVKENPEILEWNGADPALPQAPGSNIYTYSIGMQRPFQVAAHFNKERALQEVVKMSPLKVKFLVAVWNGDLEVANELQGEVANLTAEDQSILPQAAWIRDFARVRRMLEFGFDVDAVGVHHSSALDRAAFHGFDDIIELVLKYNPSLTIRNEFGGMPLGACLYGSIHSWRKDGNFPRSVQLLLAAGAELPETVDGKAQVSDLLTQLGVK